MEGKRKKNTIRKVQKQKENMKRNNINSTGNNNNSVIKKYFQNLFIKAFYN